MATAPVLLARARLLFDNMNEGKKRGASAPGKGAIRKPGFSPTSTGTRLFVTPL